MCVCVLPEAGTVLSQSVQYGVGDVGTARHTEGLQAMTTPTDSDEAFVSDLLLRERERGEGQHREQGVTLKTRPQPQSHHIQGHVDKTVMNTAHTQLTHRQHLVICRTPTWPLPNHIHSPPARSAWIMARVPVHYCPSTHSAH